MTEVKICGITAAVDAEYAARWGAWAVGVNFWPRGRRYVSLGTAQSIAAAVGGSIPIIGVFVDALRADIERLVEVVPLDMIQLHGDERPADCEGWNVPVIKALRLRDAKTWQSATAYPADYLLADAFVEGEPGGTGCRLATEWIGAGLRDRLILAGGLDPDNVSAMIRAVSPFAVDVASGVESAPGRKDPEKVKRFIDHAHHA
jgi:phosphoribosylanthranilate isomerase